jgi:hypothetical protein
VSLSSLVGGESNVTYTAGFDASSTGGLVDGEGTISIAGASGTTFPNTACDYAVSDKTTGHSGDCVGNLHVGSGGNSVSFTLPSGVSAGANDNVNVVISGVTNPAATTETFTLSTSSDSVPASSETVVLSGNPGITSSVTGAAVALSTTAEGATGTTVTITFQVSAGGGFANGSPITVVAPVGTVFDAGNQCDVVDDVTTGQNSNGCDNANFAGDGSIMTVYSGVSVNPSDSVSITATNVSNPSLTTSTISVSTVADGVFDNAPAVDLTAPDSVSGLSLVASSHAEGASEVTDTVSFTASSSGLLEPNFGQITLEGPVGTSLPGTGNCNYTVTDETTGASACASAGSSGASSPATVTMTLPNNFTVNAGDQVQVEINGAGNPPTSSFSLSVSTSSDLVSAATTESLSVAKSVTPASPSLTLSTTAAGADQVTQTINFTTSSLGSLVNGLGNITLEAAPGTGYSGNRCDYEVADLTTQFSNTCAPSVSVGNPDEGSTVTITVPITIRGSDEVRLTILGVRDPGVGSDAVSIATSSDPVVATTAPVSLVAPKAVTPTSETVSPAVTSAGGVTDTVTFKASSTGGLVGGSGSITLQGVPGTVFPGVSCGDAYEIYDITTQTSSGCIGSTQSAQGGSVVDIDLPISFSVSAGDTVTVTVIGASNPSSSSQDITVSTSSDVTPASATATPLVAGTSVTNPELTISPTVERAVAIDTVTFDASSTIGSTSANYDGSIDLEATPGTSFPSNGCDYTITDLTTTTSFSCVTLNLFGDGSTVGIALQAIQIKAGDEVSVRIAGVVNPPQDSTSFSVATNADLVPVPAPAVTLSAPKAPSSVTLGLSSSAASASGVTYTIGFTASSQGLVRGGDSFLVVVTPGTSFPGNGCNFTITDVTTTTSSGCLPQYAAEPNEIVVQAPFQINPGDQVQLVVNDVTNAADSSEQVQVITGSDGVYGSSSPVSLTGGSPPTAVGSPTLAVSNAVSGALSQSATINWNATTASTAGAGITIEASQEMVFNDGNGCDYYLTDTTTNSTEQLCGRAENIGPDANALGITPGSSIAAGDHLELSMPDVDNASGSETISIATTADPKFVTSPAVTLTAPQAVASPTLTVSSAISGRANATWTVNFTASSTGSLSSNQQITIEAPPGAVLGGNNCDITVEDVTTGHSNAGNCVNIDRSYDGEDLSVYVPNSFSIDPGDQVSIVIPGVQNPPGSSTTATVWTTTDTAAATSNAVTLATSGSLSGTSAALSSTADGAVWVTGTFGFTTSASGSFGSGDAISITGSPGVYFPNDGCGYTVTDLTTGHSANCVSNLAIADDGSAVSFFPEIGIGAGDDVQVTVAGMDNPAEGEDGSSAGTASYELTTTADATPTTPVTVSLAAAQAPADAVAALSNTTEGAAGVTASVSFQSSATDGGLAPESAITLSGPPGTVWPASGCDYTVTDTTTGHSTNCIAGLTITGDGAVATITTQNSFTVNPGDGVEVDVVGVTNPSTATDTIGIASSSATTFATSAVALTAPGSVSTPSFSATTQAAGAANSTYTVSFDTSATGQMANGQGEIELQAAPGTRFPLRGCDYTITDSTNTHSVNCISGLGWLASGEEVVIAIPSGFTIGAGDTLVVSVAGVSNPSAGSGDSISVSTSSDPVAVASNPLGFSAPNPPVSASLATSSGSVGQGNVTYSVGFTASATGALAAGSGTITMLAQAGTGFGTTNGWCAYVDDATTDRQSGCSAPSAISGNGSAITITTEINVNAGDSVVLSLTGVTNPPVAGTAAAEVWTSSDLVPTDVSPPTLSGDAITGTVESTVAGITSAVSGVGVEACPTTGACISGGTTPADGSFTFAVPPGTYWVQATPPPWGGVGSSSSFQAAEYGPVTLTTGSATGIVINLPVESTVPSGASVNGQTGVVPTIFWGSSQTITVTGCPDGTADVVLQGTDTQSGATILRTVPLTETPPGSGSYTGSVPPLSPVHGNVTVGSMVYCAPLTGVLPYAGPTSGGTAVTIYGSGFTGATAVHFGSAAATAIQVVSDSEITALTPAGTGTVRVTVTTPSGTTAASSLAEFAYLSVASVAPNTGNVSGDGTVLITGTGFSSAEQVYFGSTRTLFSVVSPTEIIAWVPPASAAGVVDITVETSGGTSPTSSADQFTYSTTAPTPSTPQQIPLPPVTGTPPICSSSGGPSVCAAPPDQRISSSPPLMQGNGGSLPAPGEILSSISSGYTYATTEGDAPPDNSGDWTSFLQSDGTTDWIGDIGPLASIGDNVNSIMDGDAFASDIAESEDFDGGFGSLSDTLAEMLGDSALEDSFLDFALGPVGGVALAAFQMYCNSANPSGFLGGACAVASVPSDLLGLALTGATSLLQKLWDEYIDPSGTVVDDKGNPISGATVTILSSSSGSSVGPYVSVPAGSVTIQPTTNPETSSSTGQFAWDVLSNWYEIEASKSGCHAPGSPSQPDSVTSPFDVPPPQDGLQIVMTCESEATPPAPTITGLSLSSGPALGQTEVSIAGSGYMQASTVNFGPNAATSVTVISPTDIEATAPAGTGTVDVTVTNSAGTSSTGAPDEFTYLSAPNVTSLSGHAGTAAGGSVIEIDGSGFDNATGVLFGAIPAINFDVISGTEIRATSPPGSGNVNVTVTSTDGSSATSSADRFTYASPLALTTTTLAKGKVGVAYSTTLKASGGVEPYSWKLSSGALPPGLSFSSAGVISGIPSKSGTYDLGIKVSDSDTPRETVAAELSLDVAANTGPGYWLATEAGVVYGFGSAVSLGSVKSPSGAVVGIAAAAPASASAVSGGYWAVTSKGSVYAFGKVKVIGHPSKVASPVTAVAAAPKGMGYWIVTSKGVVYSYGSAKSYGGEKKAPSSAVVGIAAVPKGTGYWLVSKSGAVYGFGSAKSHGSVKSPSSSVVGIAPDAAGTGYWVVTSKGVVYPFGSAKKYGGEKKAPSAAVVGIAVAPGGAGYWLAGAKGAIYGFGSAKSLGTPSKPAAKVVGIAGI